MSGTCEKFEPSGSMTASLPSLVGYANCSPSGDHTADPDCSGNDNGSASCSTDCARYAVPPTANGSGFRWKTNPPSADQSGSKSAPSTSVTCSGCPPDGA